MTKRSKFGWANFLLGLVLVALGVYTFVRPQIALSGIVILYSLVAILAGAADIVFYVRLKSNTGFGPAMSLVAGILSVLAGFMLLLNPALGSWLFGLVFAVWFTAHSVSRLANYKRIRFIAGRAVAVVSVILNSVGVVLGVLLLLNPLASSLSLGYLVGAALVLHGAGSIVEAFSRLGRREGAGAAKWPEGDTINRESGVGG